MARSRSARRLRGTIESRFGWQTATRGMAGPMRRPRTDTRCPWQDPRRPPSTSSRRSWTERPARPFPICPSRSRSASGWGRARCTVCRRLRTGIRIRFRPPLNGPSDPAGVPRAVRGGGYVMRKWISMLVAVCTFLMTGPALAHPKLVKAQPAKGAILKKAPTKIQLWFHEELDTKLSSFTVLNQKKEQVHTGDGKVNRDERRMMEGSVRSLPAGTYTVKWKAAGDDDKAVVEGTFTFHIRE